MPLDEESQRVTHLLRARTVQKVVRHRAREVMIEFTDGTRLFIDVTTSGELELSITEGLVPDDREI